jgi:hypothetical protein
MMAERWGRAGEGQKGRGKLQYCVQEKPNFKIQKEKQEKR